MTLLKFNIPNFSLYVLVCLLFLTYEVVTYKPVHIDSKDGMALGISHETNFVSECHSMFHLLHNATNEEHLEQYEKHLCNQFSHYSNYRQFP